MDAKRAGLGIGWQQAQKSIEECGNLNTDTSSSVGNACRALTAVTSAAGSDPGTVPQLVNLHRRKKVRSCLSLAYTVEYGRHASLKIGSSRSTHLMLLCM